MDSADLATPVDGKPWITEKGATCDLKTSKKVATVEIGVFFKNKFADSEPHRIFYFFTASLVRSDLFRYQTELRFVVWNILHSV